MVCKGVRREGADMLTTPPRTAPRVLDPGTLAGHLDRLMRAGEP